MHAPRAARLRDPESTNRGNHGYPRQFFLQRHGRVAQWQASHRNRMPGPRPDRRRPWKDPAARKIYRRARHAPAGNRAGHDRDRQLARERRRLRPRHFHHRPRHDPEGRSRHDHDGAVGRRPDRASHPRLLFRQRRAWSISRRAACCAACSSCTRSGLEAAGGARTRVLSDRQEHRPRPAAGRPDRPQRPRRNQPPGLQHRRRQRIRPAVRGHLRLLRHDEPGRRHPDPRDRRRPDGNQLPARRSAGPGRQGLLFQAHPARGGAQARHVRHLHGQADGRRAGFGDARAPERGRFQDRQEHLQQCATARRRAVPLYIGGLQKYMPSAMAIIAPYRAGLRFPIPNPPHRAPSTAAPINLQWGIDNRTMCT
jgi:hypothetical protein